MAWANVAFCPTQHSATGIAVNGRLAQKFLQSHTTSFLWLLPTPWHLFFYFELYNLPVNSSASPLNNLLAEVLRADGKEFFVLVF